MRILISPTAFKGTLSPSEAARIIGKSLRRRFPNSELRFLPLADGGDGTLDVLLAAKNGRRVSTRVEGPLGKPTTAEWGLIPGLPRTAVIEMARASGLALVKGKNRIMDATTAGTGELIRAALDRGCRRIFLGAGGTATSDGGAGALRALGLRYYDERGVELSAKPKDLARLARVDWKRLDPRLKKTKFVVLCDVRNPLLGVNGSARVFGPQKGATRSHVAALERILKRWSSFARYDVKNRPGAGAAGALAFGMAGFLGAELARGTDKIMEAVDWPAAAREADLIVTGEGRLDETSLHGKVAGEIARKRGRATVWAVCGSSTLTGAEAYDAGIESVFRLKNF